MFVVLHSFFIFFFFNNPATTEIYTLSLHDALPIFLILIPYKSISYSKWMNSSIFYFGFYMLETGSFAVAKGDRKSTRLNSSHPSISYAVFCLKKKKVQSRKFFPVLGFSFPCSMCCT